MAVLAIVVVYAVDGRDGERSQSTDRKTSPHRYDPRLAPRDYGVPTGQASNNVEGDAGPVEELVITDEHGRYHVVASGDWSELKGAAVEAVHPDAVVAWSGQDDCVGAIIATQRTVAKYGELEPIARQRWAALPISEPELRWFDPTRYNNRPGFRWSAKGRSKDGKTMRYQYSVANRDDWIFEVIARSPRYFSLARWCHDAVTAAVTF